MKRSRSTKAPLSLFSFQDIITSVTGVVMFLTLLLAVELTTRTVASTTTKSQAAADEIQRAIATTEARLQEQRSQLARIKAQTADFGMFTPRSAEAEAGAVGEEIAIIEKKIAELRKQHNKVADDFTTAKAALENRVSDVSRLEQLQEQKRAIEAELTELQNSQRVFYSSADRSGRRVFLVELFEADILAAEAGKNISPRRFSGVSREESFLQWASSQSPSQVRFVLIVHPGTTEPFQELREALRLKGYSTGFDLLPSDTVAVDIGHGAG